MADERPEDDADLAHHVRGETSDEVRDAYEPLPRTTAEALVALVDALDYSGMLKTAPDQVLLAVGHARSRLAIDKGVMVPVEPPADPIAELRAAANHVWARGKALGPGAAADELKRTSSALHAVASRMEADG